MFKIKVKYLLKLNHARNVELTHGFILAAQVWIKCCTSVWIKVKDVKLTMQVTILTCLMLVINDHICYNLSVASLTSFCNQLCDMVTGKRGAIKIKTGCCLADADKSSYLCIKAFTQCVFWTSSLAAAYTFNSKYFIHSNHWHGNLNFVTCVSLFMQLFENGNLYL